MTYKIILKFNDSVDELLEILNKYSIDYEVEEVYNNESEV